MSGQWVQSGARFEIASFGELVGDGSRAAMLLSLMDGRARPATELADIAGVTASTASIHLRRLIDGGLLSVTQRGRHRYYRIANEGVADALEAVALLYPAKKPRGSADPERQALAHARTCYRHLAGELGVAWRKALEEERLLEIHDGAPRLSARGIARFEQLDLHVPKWPEGKLCLDWTERQNHLGGPLGALLTEHLFRLRWLARRNDGRGVRATALGWRELDQRFNLRAGA